MAFAADSYSLRLKGLVILTFDTAITTGISNLTFLQISQDPPESIYWQGI